MFTYVLNPDEEYYAVVTAEDKKDAVSFRFCAESDLIAIGFVAGLYANQKEGITEIEVWREDALVGWVKPGIGDYCKVYDVKSVNNNEEEGEL